MAIEIKVPVLGESVTEATVTKWFKAVGDAVARDEALVELETDKVTLEVNAPAAGTLSAIAAVAGADVEVGALLGAIAEGKGATVAAPSPPEPAAAPAPAQAAEAMPLSPAVRKLVVENDLDPARIAASGKDGRLTKGDVLEFLKRGATAPAGRPVASPTRRSTGRHVRRPVSAPTHWSARRTSAHVAPAQAHRRTAQGGAEHGRHVDDL